MLKPGGTVILAETKILPQGLKDEQYPTNEQIHASLGGYHVIEVNVLGKALELGDRSGRTANVVMMGILSTLPPFDQFPPEVWLTAIKMVNSKPAVWAANYVAFYSGRELAGAAEVVV
jgi:indolepyruvate ferredoxin oxidoreductase, alpha subunit